MSLKSKVNLILVAAFALLALAVFAVQRVIVYPSFLSLEVDEANEDLSRGVDGIRREIEHLSILCGDWSAWNDMYEFVARPNQEFIEANLMATSFENNHLDYMVILNADNETVWHGGPDAEFTEVHPVEELVEIIQSCQTARPVMEPEQNKSGVLMTPDGPVLISARPIFTSLNEGPPRGVLVMGRRLDPEAIDAIAERTRVDLKAWDVAQVPAGEREMIDRPGQLRRTDQLLQIYTTFEGIDGKPALLLRADVPAAISMRGNSANAYAVVTTLALGAAVVMFISIAFGAMVIKPLIAVTRHAQRVGAGDDLEARLNMPRRDEIGQLAGEFDHMVRKLDESRNKALDAAHRAGLADNASEVLHNIGNALNSVSVSNQVLREKLRDSKMSNLGKAMEMLREPCDAEALARFLRDDPRGGKVVDYVLKLADLLAGEQRDMLAETESLTAKIAHIAEVVAMQQTQASQPKYVQNVDPAKVLDEAVAMHDVLFQSHGISVVRDCRPLPALALHKPRLMQVLVNLVKNATEAMIDRGGNGNRLTLRTETLEDRVVLEISDSGIGFGDDIRQKLFDNGFTTKSTGSGIGLHFCANAIKAMNGAISASSAGQGRGATFRIELFQRRQPAEKACT